MCRDMVDAASMVGHVESPSGHYVIVPVHDLDVRIIDAATGELLRALTINPNRLYHGTGRPPGPTRK